MLTLILIAALAGFVLSLTLIIVVGRRRATQGALLWLLAITTEKRLPLEDEINILAEGASGPRRQELRQVAAALQRGEPLGEALDHAPGLFPTSVIAAAQVGLQTATLGRCLKDAAARHTTPRPLDAAECRASGTEYLYLWLVLIVYPLIVGFMIHCVSPFLQGNLGNLGVPLPPVTQTLVDWVDRAFLEPGWIFFFAVPPVLLLGAAVAVWKGWSGFAPGWPARWYPRWEVPELLRALSAAVTAELPIDRALAALHERHRYAGVRRRLDLAGRNCRRGSDPWPALRAAGLLRRADVRLLQAAQRAGNLAWVLRELADALENRRRYRLQVALRLFQPVVVLLLGAVVLLICVAFFMPVVALIESPELFS